MNSKLSNKITNITFLLTVLVVIIHCDCMPYAASDSSMFAFSNCLNNIFSVICDIAVPSFFTISAFLFFKNFKISKYKDKLKSMFKSLIIPYLLWSFIFLIYTVIIFKISALNSMTDSLKPLGNNIFSILINNVILDSYDGPLWYVFTLIVFVFLAPIFDFIIRKFKKKSIALIPIMIGIILAFQFPYSGIVYWIPLYFLSAYLTINYYDKIINYDFIIFKYKKFLYLLFVCLILIVSFYRENYIINFLYKFISPIFIYLISKNKLFEKRPINIAKYSFFIYCSHYAVNVILKRLTILLIGNNPLLMLPLRFVTCLVTILFIYAIALFLKKLFPKFLNILLGGRNHEISSN